MREEIENSKEKNLSESFMKQSFKGFAYPVSNIIFQLKLRWGKIKDISFFNFNPENIFGKQIDDIRKNPAGVFDIFSVDDRLKIKEALCEKGLSNIEFDFFVQKKGDSKTRIYVQGQKVLSNWGMQKWNFILTEKSKFKQKSGGYNYSQDSLNALINSVNDYVWAVDLDSKITCINELYSDLFFKRYGVRLNIGVNFIDALPDNLQQLWASRLKKSYLGNGVQFEEFYNDEGRTFFTEFFVNPIKDNATVVGISIFGRDITRRKKVEVELDSMAKLPYENPDPIIRVFKDGTVLNANDPGKEFLDSWETQIGSPLPDIYTLEVVSALNTGLKSEMEVKSRGLVYNVSFVPITDKEYVNIYAKDINDRKETELALRESEERLRAIFEAANNVGFIQTDSNESNPTIIEFSPGAEKIFGYKKHEIVGRSIENLYFKKDINSISSVFRQMRIGDEGFKGELQMIKRNGELIPVWLTTYPLLDVFGEMYAVLSVAIDISEQKESDRKLRKSQERYKKLVETSPLPIIVYSNENILFVNYEGIKVLGGKSQEEFLCKSIGDIVSKEFLGFYESGGEVPFEQQFKKVNGELIDVEVRENYVDFLGQSSVQLIFEDVSEKKKAQLALIESEEKFRNIFSSTHDSIVILNFKAEFIEVNAAACKSLGYSKEEFLTLNMRDVFTKAYIPKDWGQRLNELKNNVNAVREVEMRTKSGKIIDVELSTKIIEYQGQMSMLSIARDISERKSLESKLLNAIIETEERERERFARDLHDGLGPLLSSIKLYFNVVSKKKDISKKDEMISDAYEVIDEAISSIKTISNNLSPHILNDFGLASAVSSFCKKLTIPEYIKVQFETNIGEQRFGKNVEVILYRIIKELINNSIKHASASKIFINLSLEDNIIKIVYKDNGVGFDTEAVLAQQSRGLGLFSIKNRLKSLNGTVVLKSEPGEGVDFKVTVDLKNIKTPSSHGS